MKNQTTPSGIDPKVYRGVVTNIRFTYIGKSKLTEIELNHRGCIICMDDAHPLMIAKNDVIEFKKTYRYGNAFFVQKENIKRIGKASVNKLTEVSKQENVLTDRQETKI